MANKKEGSTSRRVKALPASSGKEGAVVEASIPLEQQPVIKINNISKSYRKKLVLKDVNFEIFEKDVFGVVGMSGSGKTTLFELIAGIHTPCSGDVLIRNDIICASNRKGSDDKPNYLSVYKQLKNSKTRFGFASQVPSYYPHLTVRENLELYGRLYSIKKSQTDARIKEVLNLVGLEEEDETIAKELSGGMQRRLDIACSMIHEPVILFMDEPTSDLDPIMRKQIWKLIKKINSRGTTVVLTSHILSEVETLCTKVAILHDKKVWGYGKLSELKKLFRKGQQIRIELTPPEYDYLIKKLNRKDITINRIAEQESELVLFTPRDERNTQKILKVVQGVNKRLVRIDVSDASLTEIFEMLAKRG